MPCPDVSAHRKRQKAPLAPLRAAAPKLAQALAQALTAKAHSQVSALCSGHPKQSIEASSPPHWLYAGVPNAGSVPVLGL